MEQLTNSVVIMKHKATKQWLLSHNFHYNSRLSNEESVYTYRFPVYKHEKITTLECELSIFLDDNKIRINIYDYCTYDKYAPFYYCEYGNFDKILEIIWNNINRQLINYGIKN